MFKNSMDKLMKALTDAQEKQDYENVAKYYLELGKVYKKNGNLSKAIYYLNRFDNLVGGDNDLYEIYEKQDEKAMQWIEELEAEQEPYEKMIQAQVVEKSECLNHLQKIQWMLLTMSRFCTIFQRISVLLDFEGFEKLTEMVDYFSKGIYGNLNEEDADEIADALDEYADSIEDVFDSITMSDYTQKIALSNQPDFAPADLESGDTGTYYFAMAFSALQSFIFDTQGQLREYAVSSAAELDHPVEMEFAACGILADYYYRTSYVELKDVPKIQEETTRIFSDYDFVKSDPDYDAFQKRVDAYKNIMLI